MRTQTRSLRSLTHDESLALFKAAFGREPVSIFSCHSPELPDGNMDSQGAFISIGDDLNSIQLWSEGRILAYAVEYGQEEFQVCIVNVRLLVHYLDSLNIDFGQNTIPL